MTATTEKFEAGMRVEALEEIWGNGSVMRKGTQGVVKRCWPFLLGILPDGKKRVILTSNVKGLKRLREKAQR